MLLSPLGWSATQPTWDDFMTTVRSLRDGDPLIRADALFDSLDASVNYSEPMTIPVIDTIFQLARRHQLAGHWDRSERLFILAFHRLEHIYGSEDTILVDPIAELSSLWLAKGEYTRAIQALNRALRIVEKDFGPQSPFAADIHDQLATIYQRSGKASLADEHIKQSLKIWKTDVEPNSVTEAVLLAAELPTLWQAGKTYEGITSTNKIIDTLQKHPGSWRHAQTVLILPMVQHSEAMSHEDKITLLNKLLTETEHLKGENHPALIPVLMELEHLYRKLGKSSLALTTIHRSLRLVEEFFGRNHPGIAQIYRVLADIHLGNHQPEEALSFYNRAAAILRGNSPEYDATLATVLTEQTAAYKNLNQFFQAEQSQMEYLTMLAGKKETPQQLLEEARRDHKELVAILRQKDGPGPNLASSNFKDLITRLQRELLKIGFDPGPANGSLSTKTIKAIHDFEKRLGIQKSTKVDKKTILRILEQIPP
ncbi:MAG: tetratricopeptide repeat protein [Magnetococcales bacterium]|nr:tetratricopeptide repeat protein [Magnetococcales bacterium]